MKIKLGIAPIAWSNDDMPELGGDTPIETCLLFNSDSIFSCPYYFSYVDNKCVMKIFFLIIFKFNIFH